MPSLFPSGPRERRGPLAFLLLLLLAGGFAAAPSAAAQAPAAVQAEMLVVQTSRDELHVTGLVMVWEDVVDGRTMTAAQLASAATTRRGMAAMATLEGSVRDDMVAALAAALPGALVQVERVALDDASLAAARDEGAPLLVDVAARVTLALPELPGASDAALAAAFGAGAIWRAPLVLPAPAGYDVAWTVAAPAFAPGLEVRGAEGASVAADGSAATRRIDNARAAGMRLEPVALLVAQRDARVVHEQSVTHAMDLQLGELSPDGEVSVAATIRTQVRSLALEAAAPGALPAGLSLPFVDAAGLRALAAAGALGEDADASLARMLDAHAQASLQATAPSLRITERILTGLGPDAAPEAPLEVVAQAEGAHKLGASAQNADVALALGAALRLPLTLGVVEHPTTLILHAPPGMLLTDAEGGTLLANGSSALFPLAPGEVAPLAVTLRHGSAPRFDHERASVVLTVDMVDMAVSVDELRHGGRGTLEGELTLDAELLVVAVPASLRSPLADDVRYVSSDGLRLLASRGLLDEDALRRELELAIRETVEPALGAPLVGLEVQVLALDAPAAPGAGAPEPLRVVARASFARPLESAPGAAPQAAIALYRQAQELELPRVGTAATTYVFVLPRGLTLGALDVEGGEGSRSTGEDARSTFTIVPGASGAHARAMLEVTPAFVLQHFGGALSGAGIILLLVGLAVVGALRVAGRRRRRAPGATRR